MTGAERIAAERKRQVERWQAMHDDDHEGAELALAGVCYGLAGGRFPRPLCGGSQADLWPWGPEWDKRPGPKATIDERIRALEKGGALFAAEIDRLLRMQARGGT